MISTMPNGCLKHESSGKCRLHFCVLYNEELCDFSVSFQEYCVNVKLLTKSLSLLVFAVIVLVNYENPAVHDF